MLQDLDQQWQLGYINTVDIFLSKKKKDELKETQYKPLMRLPDFAFDFQLSSVDIHFPEK